MKNHRCEHNRRRYVCKECKGSQICKHNHIRSTCKRCAGGSLCKHGKRRNDCRDCKGGSFCKHNIRRCNCKKCKGNQICEHNRIRATCRECGGRNFCKHDRQRHSCSICSPATTFRIYVRSNKQTRKLVFTLTVDEFTALVSQPCLYCGEDEKPRGIDRWNNAIGYVFKNCRPCCKTCNYMKVKMDGAEFVEHLQRAADHTRVVEFSDLQKQFEGDL
jgi:hypothetical protein